MALRLLLEKGGGTAIIKRYSTQGINEFRHSYGRFLERKICNPLAYVADR